MSTTFVTKLHRPVAPLLVLSSVFVAAGGAVHGREWIATYRHVPASLPGANVVRVGFVVNAGVSAILVVALLAAIVLGARVAAAVLAVAATFEAASLATLIQARRGTVLGWMESGWSRGASQSRAVEIGALVVLASAMMISARGRRAAERPSASMVSG